ncbi:unnamed protein product [Cercopithifilaria johnstoni]|uniref:Uncharacterized protein n=1 Tax=Cercopithifilaria johnstoni TaxID=2874296 RepID=A0A8J2M4K4_9BILA|nr:unnamed protein product [Cercopithifilaria johnstoni]
MSSFWNPNPDLDRTISRSPTPEIPRRGGDSDNSRQDDVWNDMQMQYARMERIRQRMMEYRAILQCLRSLRSAENMKYRTKHRMMKERCERYRQKVAEEKRLNATFQESFLMLERQLSNSTRQLFHLQAESERERRNMRLLEENFEQTKEILTQFRGRIAKKNHIWNLTVKNALRAKRIAEGKLREALIKYEMEVKHSTELEEGMKELKATVKQLKLELEQKERLCNDSKIRLAIHSETASLACRQIQEANKKTAELTDENAKLHLQFANVHLKLIDSQEAHSEMAIEMSRIKFENEKHYEELQKLKRIIEVEMASLIKTAEENRILLIQKGCMVNSLTYENLEIRKRTEVLEELRKYLEEEICNTTAVLRAQHQELLVYDTSQKIRNRKAGSSNRKRDLATNSTVLLERKVEQFQQLIHHSICRVIGFRNQVTCMLENIDNFLRMIYQENSAVLREELQTNYVSVSVRNQISNQNPYNQNIFGGGMQQNFAFQSTSSYGRNNIEAGLSGISNQYHHPQQNIQLDNNDVDEVKTTFTFGNAHIGSQEVILQICE